MLCSGYDGTGAAWRTPDGIMWEHSGEGVHATDELAAMPEFVDEYEIVGSCPVSRGWVHAVVRGERRGN